MTDNKAAKGGARSAARLAAVQALYQIEASGSGALIVVQEFVDHRFGEIIDDSQYSNADSEFFSDIVLGVDKWATKIDDYIKFVAGDVLKQYSLTEKKSELIYGLPTDELVKVIKKPFPKMEDAYDFFEYKFLVAVILKNDKVLKDVCKQLKIARETLSRKISKHKINIKDLNMDFKENNIKLEELI